MALLVVRKLGFAILVLGLLNVLGFWYALQFSPRGLPSAQTASGPTTAARFLGSYRAYLEAAAGGDLGVNRGVSTVTSIRRALANSALLVVPALILVLVVGVSLGMAAFGRRGDRITAPALAGFAAGAALPGFFLGSLLILLVLYGSRAWGFRRGSVVPIQGFGVDAHVLLPIVTLAISPTLYLASITAGALEHEFQQDYVRVARSKGLSWHQLRWRHALPNVAGAVAVTFGQALRLLITELIVVEALFDWPGLGQLFMRTVNVGDAFYTDLGGRPQLLAAIAVVFGILLLLADIFSALLVYAADPRSRLRPDETSVR